jgi:flagellar hook-basal body complex protein FliE
MVNMNQIASAAYGATQKIATTPGPAEGVKGTSFADLLESGLESAIGSQHKAEALSEQSITGKADINDVILATQNADVALNTVIAIRDKVVGAYQDILRMAI